jgi:guanylate kinase
MGAAEHAATGNRVRLGRLFVVSGPSGVGKSTILSRALPCAGAVFSVSATTRQPRAGEQDGRDYFFISREQFERMKRQGELLEWAEVFGNLYGTPAEPVLRSIRAGRRVVLDIDVQGAIQVHQRMPSAVFVLIVPPDMQTLRRRLEGRSSETPEELTARLAEAQHELASARESGVYDYEVVNDDLDAAVNRLVGMIQRESDNA